MNATAFYELLEKNHSFMITSHTSPDGDSIGSVLALTLALLKTGKKAVPVINDDIPKKYKFLPGSNLIIKETSGNYDVIAALDCGDIERLGFDRQLREYGRTIVNIDHHKSNSYFGDLNLVYIDASSVGEIIYKLLDGKVEIDYDIALNLFTSIITDTGSIRYSNTTPLSLEILAKLVKKGIKPDYVSRQVFERRSLSSITLLKSVLNTLEISADGKIASLFITKDMMKDAVANEDDTDGIINYAREIEGVEVAVLFKESEDSLIKVGFRSNEWVDVSMIAAKFNGGGHSKAAGCHIKLPLKEAREIVLNTVKLVIMEESGERCNQCSKTSGNDIS
ncbi:MAG: bifunctional oligoribonuclease/PAP phosphatase NrnA [Thermoanaerobacteraceae bacterium]|nr:bifunctional oligoribonuclease/PAP phosphatase NrnA [Thermoanaerobacteraceae bacterium]